jgi:hypothetical protein
MNLARTNVEARRTPTRMVQFLDELSKAAVKYQAQLVASGCSAAAITGIATLRNDLVVKNSAQKMVRKQRPKMTEDRILVLNACYTRMALLNGAAQLVYATDYAKQQQFVYMPGSESTSGVQGFGGSIAAGQTGFVAEIDYDGDNVFTFTNTGDSDLLFCLSASDGFEGISVSVVAGATETRIGSELNPGARKLLVQNPGSVEGNYNVEVEV